MNAGDRYGRYEIVQPIGRGAMGFVYLARDTETDRDVALKIVQKIEAADEDILEAERLGAELEKRLAAVDSRVVPVNRYGNTGSDLFIEMEYAGGEDLSALISRGPIQPGFAVHVAIELCDLLENLRTFTTDIGGRQFAGVVHGDLKPKNIRINAQGQVRVLDFGIAKALAEARGYTTNLFASAAYCSPERLNTQHIDIHSDLWSVGVLLYQMLSGRLPFDAPSREKIERRIRSSDPPDPLPDSCPEPLARIVSKMLAANPGSRYQSPTDVKADLIRFRNGEPVLAEADPEATTRTTIPLSDEPDPDRTVRTARPAAPRAIPVTAESQRNRVVMGCLITVGIGTLVGIIFLWSQVRFSDKASKLKTDLQAEKIANLDDAWGQYETLAARAHLPFLLWGAKGALKNRLLSSAEATIAEYRDNDAPAVYEATWAKAHDQLSKAMELDADDKSVRGALRITEGHLDRIIGERSRGPVRQKWLNAAVLKFEEAAQLLKRSPDPYLGLARIYVYDLNDLDKAEEALRKAEDYGHPMGKREISQLADGYRRRGDRIWRESRSFADLPDQERDYLGRAKQDYKHAEELYSKVGLFGDSLRNEVAAIQGQQRVDQRLSELQSGIRVQ
jgi:tRNA A-37 threonylcarbamoyl transferase component Bud32